MRPRLFPPFPAGLLALLPGLCPAGGLVAQQPRDTVRLQEIVVTATRVPTSRAALPLATSVITGREMEERGLRTVADALRTLPGIAVSEPGSAGGVTSLFLRGGNSGYVKVLVDGVPVNDAGGAFDFANLSAADVERIEVVRGPGSVLYGSDAVTGVIQLFTRRGTGPARATAAVSTGVGDRLVVPGHADPGRYGLSDVSASASGGGRLAGWSLGGDRFSSAGIYPVNNADLASTLGGRIDLHPDARTDAALTVRRRAGDYHYPTDGGGNIVDLNTSTRTAAWTLALDASRRIGPVEAHVLLGDNATDRTDADPQDSPADTLGYFESDARTRDDRRSADAHLDWHVAGTTLLTAGAAVEREHERSRSSYRSQWGDGSDSADVARTDRGYYLQLYTAPLHAFSFTAGARQDDDTRFGRFTTWRAGAALALGAATRLRIAAGSAFKEPTFYENFARGYVRGNPALRPERSRSWEVGVEHRLSIATLRATWFEQRFRDLVQYVATAPAPGAPNYFNLGGARADGLELELGTEPAPGLRLNADYTYLRTRVDEEGTGGDPAFVAGKRLLRRPTHSASATALWYPRPATGLSATLAWVGSRDDLDFADPNAWPTPRITLPAYLRLDLAGQLPILRDRGGRPSLAGTLRLENALDRRYREIADFPARGRTLYVGVTVGVGG